jgi:hypothetical protein
LNHQHRTQTLQLIKFKIMLDWLLDPEKIKTGIVAIIGFLLAKFYDRVLSDKFTSQSALLEKLKSQTLSQEGKRRLGKDLKSSITNLQTKFKKYRQNGSGNLIKINNDSRFYSKSLTDDPLLNTCPNDSGKQYYLFYDSEKAGQSVIYNLSALAEVVEKELSEYFNDKSRDTEKSVLNSRIIIDKETELIFWMHIPNFFPENQNKLNENYSLINSIITKYIPGCQLIVEFYVTNDLDVNSLGLLHPVSNSATQLERLENSYSDLVLFRNEIREEFKKGIILGNLNYVHEPIPEIIIYKRIEEIFQNGISDLFNLFGSPGTGKTYLLQQLIKLQQKQYRGVFLIINNINVVNALSAKTITDNGQEQFYQSILDIIIDGQYNFLPSHCTINQQTLTISKFILGNILSTQSQTLYLVFDDYYLYKEVIQSMIITILDKKWKVKFIITGRPRIVDLMDRYAQITTCYECQAWNRIEALEILKSWTKRDDFEIESAFNVEILVKQDKFSVYLLRLIVNNIKNIKNESLSDILRKEIINSLSPVYTKLIGVDNKKKISYPELMKAVEEIVNDGSSETSNESIKSKLAAVLSKRTIIDIDTFIDRIGELSWASRFQSNSGNLSNELIQQHLPFLDIEYFFELGSEANIFKTDNGTYGRDWNDNLIADGCLSLLLRRNLERIKNDPARYQEFSGKLEGLRNQNSLNILSLVLSNQDIISLTNIIASTNLTRIDIIDELISDQQIEKLKEKGQIEPLIYAFITGLNRNTDFTHAIKLTRIIKKLTDIAPSLKAFLIQFLGKDQGISGVAEYWFALEHPNDVLFYQTLDQLSVDKFHSTELSVKLWDEMEIDLLMARLAEIRDQKAISQEQFDNLLTLYIEKLNTDQIVITLKSIIYNNHLVEDAHSIQVIKNVLGNIRMRSKKGNPQIKQELDLLLNHCYNKKYYEFCKFLVKTRVFTEYPKLVFDKIEWTLHKTDRVATPVYPYGLQKFPNIAADLPESTKYRIHKKGEIKDGGTYLDTLMKSNGYEIVSDNFINDSFHHQHFPANYKIVHFNLNPLKEGTLTAIDIKGGDGAEMFYWRPVFKF